LSGSFPEDKKSPALLSDAAFVVNEMKGRSKKIHTDILQQKSRKKNIFWYAYEKNVHRIVP